MNSMNVHRYKTETAELDGFFRRRAKARLKRFAEKEKNVMKKIISLLFAALLVLTAFAACSHEEKKPDGESDSYPSYSVNADDMNKEYKLDDIADLSLISSVDSAAAHFQGKEIRNLTKDLKKSDLEALVSALKGMTATAEEDKYPSKELKKSVYVQFKMMKVRSAELCPALSSTEAVISAFPRHI